jgi:hypothetical protein
MVAGSSTTATVTTITTAAAHTSTTSTMAAITTAATSSQCTDTIVLPLLRMHQVPEGDERRVTLEVTLGSSLDRIESERAQLLVTRAELEKLKKEAKRIETKLVEERAELVASNGVLEQNVKLRAAIAAEEREKFASEKEGYLQAALEEERRTMANQVC